MATWLCELLVRSKSVPSETAYHYRSYLMEIWGSQEEAVAPIGGRSDSSGSPWAVFCAWRPGNSDAAEERWMGQQVTRAARDPVCQSPAGGRATYFRIRTGRGQAGVLPARLERAWRSASPGAAIGPAATTARRVV